MIEADILFLLYLKKDGREEHDPEGPVFSPDGARPKQLYFTKTSVLALK
jgi:hypothetical protein